MESLCKAMKVGEMGQAMGQVIPLLGLMTVIRQTIPPEGHSVVRFCSGVVREWLNPFCVYNVPEFEASMPNDLYRDVQLHLESCRAFGKARKMTLLRLQNSKVLTMRLASSSDIVVDTYKGMTVWWTHSQSSKHRSSSRSGHPSLGESDFKAFHLKFRKRDKARLVPEYLDHLSKGANSYSGKTREIKIFTNQEGGYHHFMVGGARRLWDPIPYKHPSTFDTLAMDPCLKEKIIADLTSFRNDKSFYERTGRAWKRGYLLYGPPGTGKSSMVAAMANFLKYDIYDLELTQVRSNIDLRQLLVQTTNRSIILLEDIDCSVNFTSARNSGRGRYAKRPVASIGDLVEEVEDPNKITLSGLLNFVDGLWSCCGDERIFIFTTNHVQKLDPALVRAGRMDMQIEMSYCAFPAFKVLARNYLAIEEHAMYAQVENAFESKKKNLTPAQVAEILIQNKADVDAALAKVIEALLDQNTPIGEVPTLETNSPPQENGPENVEMGGNKSEVICTLRKVIQELERVAVEAAPTRLPIAHHKPVVSPDAVACHGRVKSADPISHPDTKNSSTPPPPASNGGGHHHHHHHRVEYSSNAKELVASLRKNHMELNWAFERLIGDLDDQQSAPSQEELVAEKKEANGVA